MAENRTGTFLTKDVDAMADELAEANRAIEHKNAAILEVLEWEHRHLSRWQDCPDVRCIRLRSALADDGKEEAKPKPGRWNDGSLDGLGLMG